MGLRGNRSGKEAVAEGEAQAKSRRAAVEGAAAGRRRGQGGGRSRYARRAGPSPPPAAAGRGPAALTSTRLRFLAATAAAPAGRPPPATYPRGDRPLAPATGRCGACGPPARPVPSLLPDCSPAPPGQRRSPPRPPAPPPLPSASPVARLPPRAGSTAPSPRRRAGSRTPRLCRRCLGGLRCAAAGATPSRGSQRHSAAPCRRSHFLFLPPAGPAATCSPGSAAGRVSRGSAAPAPGATAAHPSASTCSCAARERRFPRAVRLMSRLLQFLMRDFRASLLPLE